MSDLVNIGVTIGKGVIVSELKKRGNKQINLDKNSTGKDDAGGRALLALADAVDTVEFTDNPKALRNIGKAMIAAGNKLMESADEIEEG
jgi:hypothetical protein